MFVCLATFHCFWRLGPSLTGRVNGGERNIHRLQSLTCAHCGAWASQVALVVKNLPAIAGDVRDMGLIPGPGECPGERNGNSRQYSCLENPRDWGVWRATVHRVIKSWTWLRQLSNAGPGKQGVFLFFSVPVPSLAGLALSSLSLPFCPPPVVEWRWWSTVRAWGFFVVLFLPSPVPVFQWWCSHNSLPFLQLPCGNQSLPCAAFC